MGALGPSQDNQGELPGGYQPAGMMSEINVTPFVDVMLVLLIIFMVSAPLMQQGVNVDLPKTKSPALAEQDKPIVLVVEKNGSVKIAGNSIPLSGLREKLSAIYENREKREIFVQADQSIPYGTVAAVMAQAQAAGITKIGLVTQPKSE